MMTPGRPFRTVLGVFDLESTKSQKVSGSLSIWGWPVHRGCVGWKREEGAQEMRKLMVSTFLTLDGVMQAPGGPGEDDSGGFAHGGWSVNYWDERMGQVMDQALSNPFAMVLGRRTYDIMAAYWPHASEAEGAKVFNDATKYVASRGPRT